MKLPLCSINHHKMTHGELEVYLHVFISAVNTQVNGHLHHPLGNNPPFPLKLSNTRWNIQDRRHTNSVVGLRRFVSFFLSLASSTYSCRRKGLLLHLITLKDTHTHTHTLGRIPLDEGSARRRDLYLTTHNTEHSQESRRDSDPQSQQARDRRPTP